jgi:type II secretory pathway component PulF
MSDGICVYCKGNIEAGASKCRSCGEWVDSRWRLSGAGIVCLALIAVALLAMGAISVTWVPLLRGMLADFGGPIPMFTRIILSSWWLPAWMALVVSAVASSFIFTTRIRPRLTVLACALAVGLAAVVVSYAGVYLPIVNMATDIGPK